MCTRVAWATLVIVIVGIAVVFQNEGPHRRKLQREPAMVRSPAHVSVGQAPPKNKFSGLAARPHVAASYSNRPGCEVYPRGKRGDYSKLPAFGIVRFGFECKYVAKPILKCSEKGRLRPNVLPFDTYQPVIGYDAWGIAPCDMHYISKNPRSLVLCQRALGKPRRMVSGFGCYFDGGNRFASGPPERPCENSDSRGRKSVDAISVMMNKGANPDAQTPKRSDEENAEGGTIFLCGIALIIIFIWWSCKRN